MARLRELNIVATLIGGAKWYDARNFIKTERKNGKHVLDNELTNKLVLDTFDNLPWCSLVPSFISRDRDTDETYQSRKGRQ